MGNKKRVSLKEYKKKEVRKLEKESWELYKKLRELGYRKLEKPIRHGWYKELILTPQLERYKFKPEVEEIIAKLERQIWGRTKEEAQKRWDCQVSKHMIYRNVPTLSPKSYRKLSDKAKRLCTVFVFYEQKKMRRRYYVRIPKHAYKVKFRRAYTTHSKIIDPSIIERLALIDQQFHKKGWFNYAYPYNRYYYRDVYKDIRKERQQSRISLQKHTNTSLNEVQNELKWGKN